MTDPTPTVCCSSNNTSSCVFAMSQFDWWRGRARRRWFCVTHQDWAENADD